mgnify:CR=1 FL=1
MTCAEIAGRGQRMEVGAGDGGQTDPHPQLAEHPGHRPRQGRNRPTVITDRGQGHWAQQGPDTFCGDERCGKQFTKGRAVQGGPADVQYVSFIRSYS